jgi:hypothetical protein
MKILIPLLMSVALVGCNEGQVVKPDDLLAIPPSMFEQCPEMKELEGKTFGESAEYILYLIEHNKHCSSLNDEKIKFIKDVYDSRKK